MTVEISTEVYRMLERQVQEGRYDSMQQAFEGNVHQADALNRRSFDPDFIAYVRGKVDEGLADLEAGRVVPAEEVIASLRNRAAR